MISSRVWTEITIHSFCFHCSIYGENCETEMIFVSMAVDPQYICMIWPSIQMVVIIYWNYNVLQLRHKWAQIDYFKHYQCQHYSQKRSFHFRRSKLLFVMFRVSAVLFDLININIYTFHHMQLWLWWKGETSPKLRKDRRTCIHGLAESRKTN